jgi:DNA-binding transcriptional MocR family regulator
MKVTGSTVAEIFDNVRLQVLSGALRPGDALPPVRELAAQLGVNRNTVASAYKRLAGAGIASTQGRLGTAICAPAALSEQEGRSPGSPLHDMASGNPNPLWLPNAAALMASVQTAPRLYGDATINEGLIALANSWFAGDCPPGHALDLSHGAVDAIERLAAAHLVPGDLVAVEDPCFLGTINALRISGMQTLGVAIDGEGMLPTGLAQALKAGARAVLITPRAHNPTGCSLTAERAAALKRVLSAYPHVLVIVDDHFALLADSVYQSVIPETTSRWALVRSMSKALGPDLRLAFVASDAATSGKLRLRLAPGMTWVSHLLQDLVEACLRSATVAAQIQGARAAYAARRLELVAALAEQGITCQPPADGFNVWLPIDGDGRELCHAMARLGWLVRAGDSFEVELPAQALRITVSTLAEGQATALSRDMRRCMAR